MPSAKMSTPGSQTLAQFQTVVRQMEEIYGPLIALGTEGPDNTMTFDVGACPAQPPELATYATAAPPAKSGYAMLCAGDCLVGGQAAKVVAYRKA